MHVVLLVLLLAAPAGAVSVFLPQYTAVLGRSHSATPDQMVCTTVAAPFAGSFTKIAGRITTGSASQFCGFAIYPDSDGGTALAKSADSCAAAGNITDTVSSFSLVAGTLYRLCTCSTSTATDYLAVRAGGTGDTCVSGVGDDGCISALLNAHSSPHSGTAANGCDTDTALPPDTTGTITPVDSFPSPVIVVE